MQTDPHILLWSYAEAQVLDIRHVLLELGEEVRSYRLPASSFLYAVRGRACIMLDGSAHQTERFHVLHGGKGMCLDILPLERTFEYYLIFYKAALSLSRDRRVQRLLEQHNPFQLQYGFIPRYPVALYEQAVRMFQEWRQSGPLERLHIKGMFYQFVHEVFRQLQEQGIRMTVADPVEQVIRYIHEHYRESVTLEVLAQFFNYSAPYLSKQFRRKTGFSIIDYLIKARVDKAMDLLVKTNMSIQEAAESVGYTDVSYFARVFRKHAGMSPKQFREDTAKRQKGSFHPVNWRAFSLAPDKPGRYIDNSSDNDYQYRQEGENTIMYRNAKPNLAAVMLLCVTLILSACGGTPKTSSIPTGGTSQPGAAAVQEATAKEGTRMVSTLKGEVEVPAEPNRVVSDQYFGQLLKLGIIPIGVRSFMLGETWIEKAGISKATLAQIEDLGGFPMDLEKLVDLKPDLIIGSREADIEKYQKIGTTVFLPYWEEGATTGPLNKFRRIAEIFGKQQEAEQWIGEYEQKVEEAKKKIVGIVKPGETVSVVSLKDGKSLIVFAAEGGNYGSPTIYQMLQLPPTEHALNMKEGYMDISLEVMPQYMGDHIFVFGSKDAGADDILSNEVWKSLPAVKKGQVYMYGSFSENGEFIMEDPYSLELQLESIVSVLMDKQS